MSAKTIVRLIAAALGLAALVATAAWWHLFRTGGDMDRAVAVIDAHERELAEILHIVQMNPRLCFVSTVFPIETNCPEATGPRDRADYERIVFLMRSSGIEYLSLWRDDATGDGTRVLQMEFRIFDADPARARGPIVGVWHGPFEVQQREPCTRARRPGWSACEARFVFAP